MCGECRTSRRAAAGHNTPRIASLSYDDLGTGKTDLFEMPVADVASFERCGRPSAIARRDDYEALSREDDRVRSPRRAPEPSAHY